MRIRRMGLLPIVSAGAALGLAGAAQAQLSFTLFHHSDAESSLINAPGQASYGGIARFKSKLDALRTAAGPNTLAVASGDMFLAGANFNASQVLPAAQPFYDGVGLSAMNYDALALGNHEFDFGPQTTGKFLRSFVPAGSPLNDNPPPRFLSANLNFAAEPELSPLVGTGKLARSITTTVGGQTVGIIGATTTLLPAISSPGPNITVNPVLAAVQAEADALHGLGVKHIVLLSHLQNIQEEIALIPQLRHIDVVVAGGGEELVSNAGVPLVPGDVRPSQVAGLANQYPLMRNDSDGRSVALVGTAGQYKYIGELSLNFNAAGELVGATGDPRRVADLSVDAVNGVTANASLQANVVSPVQAHRAVLDANLLAETQSPLEGRRNAGSVVQSGTTFAQGIRNNETNLGDLSADSIRWGTAKSAAAQGVSINPNRLVGLQNGGGIRNNTLIPASPAGTPTISEGTTFDIHAFGNFATLVEDVSPTQLKQILEHSVASIGGGQFGHWSGLSFSYDFSKPAGSRVFDVFLDDGTQLIDEGSAVGGAPLIDLATINFLAAGGDNYPIGSLGLSITSFPLSYQEALEGFLAESGSFGGLTALDGLVSSSLYAPLAADNYFGFDPERRIDAIPEPGAMCVLAGGVLAALRRGRRQ